jgi:starch phosphorylase
LGDGSEHGDDPAWDAIEAEELYTLLEQQVIPEFYSRNKQGIPTAWVARMRESMAQLTPQFSANRTVQEYTGRYYIPAAAAYLERATEKGKSGSQMVDWQHTIHNKWANVRFGDVTVKTNGEWHLFEAQVYLNGIAHDAVHVELYADKSNGESLAKFEMNRDQQLAGAENGYIYKGRVPATRPSGDFTARIIPHFTGAAIPLEESCILWQR